MINGSFVKELLLWYQQITYLMNSLLQLVPLAFGPYERKKL